jgi:cobalt-zinc-cadmium efflux system outer membrane protein
MHRNLPQALLPALVLILGGPALAQTPMTWQQVKAKFETANPTLAAARINIDESKAQEITAYLRPNPDFSFGVDQFQPLPGTPYRPLSFLLPLLSVSYLHERQHKRELRLESARKGTDIAESEEADLERTMIFNLRSAFVQTLQAKAVLELARANLQYFDHSMQINQTRYNAGDIALVDLQRLQLQRVQYETDYETAIVQLQSAKITLRMMLNDKTPIERFDIAGLFEFNEALEPLEEFHNAAMAERPDLKAAVQSVEKAQTDHKLAVANGSTDPTFSFDSGRNPPLTFYFGAGVNIPLRIFDRNQGEKLRTEIDIRHAERQKEAVQAQVFSDVDSAYATLTSTLRLLKPYKSTYLQVATDVRNKSEFAYQHGAAALLDYLDAQREFRQTQLSYLNLIGSYLTAVGQLNMAVGREVIQ